MAWIKEAEEEGRRWAEQKATDRAHFSAEKVTEEAATELLERHLDPIITIVEDLKSSSYIVDKIGPGFLPHWYKNDNPFLREVSLTRTVATAEEEGRQEIFGVEWKIQKEIPHGARELGRLTVYPIVNERTHLAGVVYMALSNDGQLTTINSYFQSTPSDGTVNGQLQQSVRDWISKAAR